VGRIMCDVFHRHKQGHARVSSAMKKTALIVGVSGIVGYNLAEHLVSQTDWTVYGVARRPGQREGVIPIAVDLQDGSAVQSALKDVKANPHVSFHGMEEVIGSIPIRSTNPFNNLDYAGLQMSEPFPNCEQAGPFWAELLARGQTFIRSEATLNKHGRYSPRRDLYPHRTSRMSAAFCQGDCKALLTIQLAGTHPYASSNCAIRTCL
jgi:hypothetical protein